MQVEWADKVFLFRMRKPYSIASTQISITHNDRFRISDENICPVCFINQTQALKRSSLNQNRSIDRSAFLFSKNKCFPAAID